MTINRVPVDSVRHMWRMVEPLLEPALAVAGDVSLDGARARLMDQTWALWTAAVPGQLVAVALTEVQQHDNGAVLVIYAGGADTGHGREAVAKMAGVMERYGRHYDCRAIRWHGRPGWRRSGFLPPNSRHVADVMEIAL